MHPSKMIWRRAAIVRDRTLDLTPMIPPRLLLTRSCVEFRPIGRLPVIAPDYVGRTTVRDIVGSLRNLRLEHCRLTGTLRWASDEHARSVQRGYESGDLVFRFEYFVMEEMESGQPGLTLATRWQPVLLQLRRKDGVA